MYSRAGCGNWPPRSLEHRRWVAETDHPDLIELLDGAGSDDGRAFDLSPGVGRSTAPTGTGRDDLDGMIRGRATAGAKGGKND
jgi:hypothetical protein